ncbi:MAG: 2-dehydro-3-deoxygalactonokinase [Sphingomonadales bacterium]|nr:2-dehydro-3-deoxygalactonokinase [Sphingomonadales bacterium]
MNFTAGFIAVDWGTTNRRAYRLGADGRHGAEFEDDQGVLSIAAGEFPAAVAIIRERLGDLPMILAGMVGSNRGWVEAPYVPCPAGFGELASALRWAEPGRAAIVPGLSLLSEDRADVMRGEEVQLLGAVAAGSIPKDGLACHPGTHNKWVVLREGRIASFRTVMTGELFNDLKRGGILADWLGREVEVGDAFRAGVRQGLRGGAMGADLFSVRARILLGRARAEDASSFTSGLLIGADVHAGLADGDGPVTVIGRPELTRLYAAAIAEAGRTACEVDGEAAFLAGIVEIARRIS